LKRRDELQFRARSAFKLIEIQERYPFLPNVKERSKGAPLDPENIVIVDLGAAPGGWSQAAARLLGRDWEDVSFEGWGASASRPHDKGTVISVDLLPIEPIPGCHIIQGDFLDPATWRQIEAKIGGREKPEIDVLLSDMAPSATGINSTDTEGQLELNRAVLEFVQRCLRKGGTLLMKHFVQAASGKFKRTELDPFFHAVKSIKPSSSRKGSPEVYYLCRGFKGIANKKLTTEAGL